MDKANQGAPAARNTFDSLGLIARDAASYAEGAGEPEFSQFLNIEARILAMARARASLEPCATQLADALERLMALLNSYRVVHVECANKDVANELQDAEEACRVALRAAGRMANNVSAAPAAPSNSKEQP